MSAVQVRLLAFRGKSCPNYYRGLGNNPIALPDYSEITHKLVLA
nr:hypothetical protein [Arthrospira sp. PLM2.Bin9]